MQRMIAGFLMILIGTTPWIRGDDSQEKISSSFSIESRAEFYLQKMAESLEKARNTRKYGGIALAGIGIGCGVLGGLLAAEGEVGIGGPLALIAVGGLSTTGGIWSLSQVSRVDRFVREVRAIQNPSEREKAAQKALANLASGGKTIRFIGFGLCALGCGVGLFAKQEETTIHGTEEKSLYPYAALFAGLGVVMLAIKTPEEIVYRDFQEESRKGMQLAFALGPDLGGGFRLRLALSF